MAMQRISRLAEVISAVFTISRLPIAHPLEGVYALSLIHIFLLYKPVVGALRKAKLMPESTGHAAPVEGKKHLGMTIVILFVFITCVLFALSLQGII